MCCDNPFILFRGQTMLMQADESQLVLVDFQARLKPAMLDAEGVWANAARLATLAKALQ
jgi:hypothetical protein